MRQTINTKTLEKNSPALHRLRHVPGAVARVPKASREKAGIRFFVASDAISETWSMMLDRPRAHHALELVPEKRLRFSDRDMLRDIELARILIDQAISA